MLTYFDLPLQLKLGAAQTAHFLSDRICMPRKKSVTDFSQTHRTRSTSLIILSAELYAAYGRRRYGNRAETAKYRPYRYVDLWRHDRVRCAY